MKHLEEFIKRTNLPIPERIKRYETTEGEDKTPKRPEKKRDRF